jgi:endonuclease/exonuclease/phosphatase family metal-dependent hydrolase
MNTRLIYLAPRCWWMGLALALAAAPSQAASIRVTTWDLQPGAVGGTNSASNQLQPSLVPDAAESLKKLRPDVILLQGVAGWETCRELAQALQPETYQIVICSSFRGSGAKLLGRQVAILSKVQATLAWSEPWQKSHVAPAAGGGFAFAAMRLDNKNVGFFSVELGDGVASGTEESRSAARQQQARRESARQLVNQIATLQGWRENRPQAFIVGGDFDATQDDSRWVDEKTLPLLEQAGFENALAGLPLEKRITLAGDARRPAATLDYILTRDAGMVAPALITPGAFGQHAAVTCEMDLDASKAPPAAAPLTATDASTGPTPAAAQAELPPAQPTAEPTNLVPAPGMLANDTSPAASTQTVWWLAAFLAAAAALFVVARKLARLSDMSLVPADAPETKARAGAKVVHPRADRSNVVPLRQSTSFAQVEVEGTGQAPSQPWRARKLAGRVPPRMSVEVFAGVIANLTRWLKEKAVHRLVSDRAQLLATQEAAARALLAVEQRLARVEQELQQMKQEYEQRIDGLLKDLVVAQEDNREMIHAKIALAKAEMEKSRLRALRHTQQQQPN